MQNTEAIPRPSVILIREWETQMSSSGCCGRLEGDFLVQQGGERCFPERRSAMEAMGPLYRDLRTRYGDALEITVADGSLPAVAGPIGASKVPGHEGNVPKEKTKSAKPRTKSKSAKPRGMAPLL